VHQDAQRLLRVVLEDQRLDDDVLIDAEMPGGCPRAAAWLPGVQMRRELDLVLAEHAHRHGDRVVGGHVLR
jgi:hypothetical protein